MVVFRAIIGLLRRLRWLGRSPQIVDMVTYGYHDGDRSYHKRDS